MIPLCVQISGEANIPKQISVWRKYVYVPTNEIEFQWNNLHVSIVGDYLSYISATCDFPELPSEIPISDDEPYIELTIVTSYIQKLEKMFVVPRLSVLHETQNQINRFQLIEAFLSFLLRLLYHKTDLINVSPFEDGVENLEKELRFLLTILGDISWMHHAEFQNLLPEFEALANRAGSFVYNLFFSAFERMDDGLAAVLSQINIFKANLQSSVSTYAYTTSPRTSVMNSILILDSLVDDLEGLLKGEDDRIADVKDHVNLLHRQLRPLHSLINVMRSPQPSEIGQLKQPLMRIGDMTHQAEYLIASFLVKDAPLWYVINRLTDLNHKIELTTTEIQVICQKYPFGGLKEAEYFNAELILHDKRNAEVNNVTVGFEDKTTDILDQLVGGGTKSRQIVSILGMPGLGKTTLAKKLYNHPLVNYTFDKLSWCVVSQTYKRQIILANILIHINGELGKDRILNMDEISLVEHIHKTLKGRRYMIVLDDIWDPNVSDELLRCFPDDGNGSRILLTSRNKDVAPHNSIIHELPFLSDEQCWELLEQRTFGSRTCPIELQGIGKKIAAKCCGLPLTVVAIAGVLATLGEEESTWEEVRGSLASYIDGEDNSVMQILELSYKHLPDRLKPCFLYFGEFKEDEEISVGNLKRLWVAEGFTRKENGKSAENVAKEYLMELIEKNLVMVAKRRSADGKGVKACVVHDLLRDLCLKISKEESFLENWENDYHTIRMKGHRVQANGHSETLNNCQHVRSFEGTYLRSGFYVRDMRLLRVFRFYMDFDGLFGVEYLVNLRFLVIHKIPIWIDRFLNLEHVYGTRYACVCLSPAIMKMTKLRYLHAHSVRYSEDCKMNKLRCQTNNLEYLAWVTISDPDDEELLKCSPHLRKLKCHYDMDVERASPHFDLRFLTQLDSLTLHGFLSKRDFGFPSSIRKLTLWGSGLPWEKMSIVGKLEFLEVLKYEGESWRPLNKDDDSFERERWDTRDGEFQKLKFLQLEKIQLSEWNVASYEHFPVLEQLILIACWHLQEIPGEIGEITTLELIEVKKKCPNSLAESAERIQEEQREMGNEELRVIIRNDRL